MTASVIHKMGGLARVQPFFEDMGYFRAAFTSQVVLPDFSTINVLTPDNVIEDTHSMYDSGTGRLTVPVGLSGYIDLTAGIQATSVGFLIVAIQYSTDGGSSFETISLYRGFTVYALTGTLLRAEPGYIYRMAGGVDGSGNETLDTPALGSFFSAVIYKDVT